MQPNPQLIELPDLNQAIDRYPLTVTPDTLVVDVINLMSRVQDSGCAADTLNSSLESGEFRQERASCVLVVEGTQLLGIFTEGDVVRLVANGMDFSGITIAVVMVKPVVTLKQSQAENVFAVLSLMQQHKIHYIPILNQHEELVGIVTQTNLLQGFNCVKTFGVAALQQQQEATGVEQQSIELIQVNQELQEALEEVQIVEEELREQNEELASTRQEIELERQRYQDLFEFAPEAYLITDIAGKIQQANQVAATLLCVPQNRLVGKPLLIFIANSDRKTFRTQLSQLQQKQNWEVYLQPREGKPFPAAIAVTSMHNSQGQRVGLRWLIRDITIHKQMEQSLQAATDNLERLVAQRTAQLLQANALLQQEILVRATAEEQIHFQANILSQVNDAVIAIDNEFRVTYWNRGAERLYGVKADEIIGRQLQESHQYRWLNPEDEQAAYNALAATGSWQGENIHVKKNKEEIYVDSSVSVLKDNSGATIGLLAVIRNITERKQAQELIKTSAAELNQIFTMLPTFVWKFCPSSHQFIYASEIITELSGLSREAFLQNYHIWNERVDSGKESQQAIEIAWQAIAHGEPYRVVYLFHTLHKGSRWFEITARPAYESGVLYYYGCTTDITERKQAEVELRESEARFRQIAENINEVFFICTVDAQQMLYISPAYEKIWGRTCESVYQQPRSWLEAIHPDDYERVQAGFARQINGEEFQEEYRIIRPDGDIRWIFDRTFGVYDEAGQLVYFVGLVEDISERKQAEVALRESEARFRTMADNAPVMIWVNGTDKYCHYCNKRWLEFTGRTLEQERGNGWTEDIHPEDLQRCLDTYFTAFDARQPFTIEYRLQRFDGEYRWILDTGTPLYNGDGSFAGYIGSCIDITERELSQQKIREQAALLDVATDAILVQDLENKILYWNQSAEQVYGWKVKEALSKNANELLYKETSLKLEEVLQTVTLKGEWQGELSQIHKNGKEIIVESRWTLVLDKQGQPKSILTVNTDITEKRQLEAQFFRIQRLESLGTLASGIAHDLNNILAPTLMSAQLLQKKISDVQSQQLLATVESSAKRGASLVKQVLSFARGVAGERTILQVKHLILEIERIVKQTFPKSIQFYTDVVSDLWMISGNSTQLHQVLMNLVVNARDAMPNGGTMSIIAKNFFLDEYYALMNVEATVGSYIVVTVADTGTGIPPEIIDRIFDPFFTTKEVGLGTGLGLSTVMGIIKNHGGFVTVESEVNKGSEFKVYLPAVNGMETTQPKEEMKLPKGHGELILVVDDESHLRETTKILLESYNYKVLTASDGIEALTVYAQHKDEIRVVLMDMMMPNMDGAISICTLQKINPHLKVIAVSGLPSNDQLAYAARINIKAFLSKPYTLRELLNIINSILSAS